MSSQTSDTPIGKLAIPSKDYQACKEAIRAGSKSFYAASLLLPKRIRLPVHALYSFCRSSDDLVDDENGVQNATGELKARLRSIYDGNIADHSSDRAFALVVDHYEIPKAIPLAMIEGFEWDEQVRHYQSVEDLLAYCARVASTVGVMTTLLMDRRDPRSLARAADLGLAMQLTNIARDVGEDARNGRIYLPLDWLKQAGIEPDELLNDPRPTPALSGVVQRLLDLADSFYERGFTGVGLLPLDCRLAIKSAGLIYREIGIEIRKNHMDSINHRAHTTSRKKLELIAFSAAMPFTTPPVNEEPAHSATAFLVDAAMDGHTPAIRGLDAKIERFLELMVLPETRRQNAEQGGGVTQ